ncbi:recombinase RecT [Methylobacterium terrae]|uniref:recombinase RecT n=1 Tax=Methylobacterium terrae TaxID=2202827 RepID=UPI001FE15547|nr:recombinase RecT [Methylobacterium terrae]
MSTAVAERSANPLVVMNEQIQSREEQFKAALPAHIPVERFKRILLTAVQNNPDLMKLERRSFFNAAMRAAQDGLLPDGRESAIVEFKGRAQFMPMIAGIRKKVRNSGEIATWEAHVVFENDEFVYELGDAPVLRHKPALRGRGKPIAAYSIAVLKTGEITREVMSIEEIEKVRGASRARNAGPWMQWWEEMARKTVARRHSKVLPMSTDLDDLMRRDDDLYDFKGAQESGAAEQQRPRLASMLDQIAQRSAEPEAPAAETAEEPVDGDVVEEAVAEEQDTDPADEEALPEDDFPGNNSIEPTRRGRGRSGGEG